MSNDLPLVSIVTPSLNQGRFIEDTILSIKNQDYPYIEHVVVDGGSTDETLKILKKYENEHNLRWISEPDEGQSDAVNKGFRLAEGEIIGWLNSDDVYFDRRVISYIVEKFKEFPNADVIYGGQAHIDRNGTIIRVRKASNWKYKRVLRGLHIPTQPATFFRRKVILNDKLDKDLKFCMDFEFWLRLGRAYSFLAVEKILAGNRIYGEAKRFSGREALRKERKSVMEKYGQSFGFTYNVLRAFDKFQYLLKILSGIKAILRIENNELAFKAKIPGKLTRIKNQFTFPSIMPGL